MFFQTHQYLVSFLQLWYNGLVTFDERTLEFADELGDIHPAPFTGNLSDFSAGYPYWAPALVGEDYGSGFGSIYYTGEIQYEIHDQNSEALRNVSDYIQDVEAIFEFSEIAFEAVWMLVVQWNVTQVEDYYEYYEYYEYYGNIYEVSSVDMKRTRIPCNVGSRTNIGGEVRTLCSSHE